MHYYFTKYPYLQYPFTDFDGEYVMFSVPPELLVYDFIRIHGTRPFTFFDCGAATGEIVWRAERFGLNATGIDVKEYPIQRPELEKLFTSGKIQIKSILDCDPIKADLAYCNGTLTYFTEEQIPDVLRKFVGCKMLSAIHNTTEDIDAAQKQGDELLTCNKLRLIKPRDWWLETFNRNGFNAEYNRKTQCFYALSKYLPR